MHLAEAKCLAKHPAAREPVCVCTMPGCVSQGKAQAASLPASIRQSSKDRRPLIFTRTASLGWTQQLSCCTGSRQPRSDDYNQPGKDRTQPPLGGVRCPQGLVLPCAMQPFADSSLSYQSQVHWLGLTACCTHCRCGSLHRRGSLTGLGALARAERVNPSLSEGHSSSPKKEEV